MKQPGLVLHAGLFRARPRSFRRAR